MSIINEALKKTQTRLQQKTPQALASGLPNSNKVKEEKSTWLLIAVILISIGFLGCAGMLIFVVRYAHRPATGISPKQEVSLPAPKTTIAQPAPAPTKKKIKPQNFYADLTLEGIVFLDGEQLALINDQYFKTGDRIGDKKILNISKDSVEIYHRGKVITLKTK